jgi:hypothetical protein
MAALISSLPVCFSLTLWPSVRPSLQSTYLSDHREAMEMEAALDFEEDKLTASSAFFSLRRFFVAFGSIGSTDVRGSA